MLMSHHSPGPRDHGGAAGRTCLAIGARGGAAGRFLPLVFLPSTVEHTHFDAVVHASPQDAQPWVRDHFEARQPPVDRKNASVVLIGVHKTGSELAKKLVSVTCGQLSLCCNMMSSSFTSVDTLNTMLASPSEPLDLFFSNHF